MTAFGVESGTVFIVRVYLGLNNLRMSSNGQNRQLRHQICYRHRLHSGNLVTCGIWLSSFDRIAVHVVTGDDKGLVCVTSLPRADVNVPFESKKNGYASGNGSSKGLGGSMIADGGGGAVGFATSILNNAKTMVSSPFAERLLTANSSIVQVRYELSILQWETRKPTQPIPSLFVLAVPHIPSPHPRLPVLSRPLLPRRADGQLTD